MTTDPGTNSGIYEPQIPLSLTVPIENSFFYFNADKAYSYMVINFQKNSDAS